MIQLTTETINNYASKVRDYYRSPEARKKSRDEADARREVEVVALERTRQMCDKGTLARVRESRRKIDDSKLKQELGKQFMNPNVVRATACTIGGSFFNLATTSLTLQESISVNFTGLKKIGSESVYGYALLGSFGNATGMFIAKTPRRGKGTDIEHELFVTLNGTNKMREEYDNPNFAMVYGGLSGSKAIIDPDTNQVVEMISPNMKGNLPYIIYENISPGVTAHQYIETGSKRQIASMLLQFTFAVAAAYAAIGFTHYDAHTENFIMRETPQKKTYQIEYKLGGKSHYVAANMIGTFIDYGMSVIRYNGEYVGVPDPEMEKLIMYTDKPHPLHDVYKFLMFTLKGLLDSNKMILFNELAPLVTYFNNKESAVDIVKKQWDKRYSIPLSSGRTIEGFVTFMVKSPFFSLIYSPKLIPSVPLFQCNNCWTFEKLYRAVERKGNDLSLIQYYDLYAKVNKRPPLTDGNAIDTHVDVIEESLSKPVPKALMELSLRGPRNYSTLSTNRIQFYTHLRLLDRLLLYVKAITWYAKVSQDEELSRHTLTYYSRVRALKTDLCKALTVQKEEVKRAGLSAEEASTFDDYNDVTVCDIDFRTSTKEFVEDSSNEYFVMEDYESAFPSQARVELVEDQGVVYKL